MNRQSHSELWNQLLEDALQSIMTPTTDSSNNIPISSTFTSTAAPAPTTTTVFSNDIPESTTANNNNSSRRNSNSNSNRPSLDPVSPPLQEGQPTSTGLPTSTGFQANPLFSNITSMLNTSVSTENDRYHQRLDHFLGDWFDGMSRYHNNMRQYQHNMNQFNRLCNTILAVLSYRTQTPIQSPSLSSPLYTFQPPSPTVNTAGQDNGSGSGRTPFIDPRRFLQTMPVGLQEFLRNAPGNVEIQGITIPIQYTEREESTQQFPTITQIYQATEVFVYNDENASRVTDTRCPITLDDFEHGEELCEIRHCHHIFKWTSLQRWFSQNTHCPVCRHNIV